MAAPDAEPLVGAGLYR